MPEEPASRPSRSRTDSLRRPTAIRPDRCPRGAGRTGSPTGAGCSLTDALPGGSGSCGEFDGLLRRLWRRRSGRGPRRTAPDRATTPSRRWGGWAADEALAIGLYCALVAESLTDAVVPGWSITAVDLTYRTSAGESVRCQALGERWQSMHWLEPLELRDVITEIADDPTRLPRDWQTTLHRHAEHLCEVSCTGW